ncbi:MAG TPA: hypothetical protein VJ964_12395 [Balneolaceae bacterium]|nr:hypothetical protein [Balneolaceae bacterium]
MASEEKNYTSEFKKEVAQKALDQSKKNLDKLSEKYDVPVSVILMWATELEKGGIAVFEEAEEVEHPEEKQEEFDVVVSDDKVADSLNMGVMLDKLNYKRLIFWSVLGVVLFVIFVRSLIAIYETDRQDLQQEVASQSQFHHITELKTEARDKINSFGVVNLDKGVYRIPIDSAINEMASDQTEKP